MTLTGSVRRGQRSVPPVPEADAGAPEKIKPDIYLLGEIWHDASQWLAGDEYDSVMNYPLMSGIHDFFLDKSMGKETFEFMVNRCYTMYMQQNNNVLFNLLDSHDTERLMNRFHDLDIFTSSLPCSLPCREVPAFSTERRLPWREDTIRTAGGACPGRSWIRKRTVKEEA